MCNLRSTNFDFHKTTTKTENFNFTNMSVPLNFQDLEEFHPPTGYCEGTCFYLGDCAIERGKQT